MVISSELFHPIAWLVWQARSENAEFSLYKEILLFGAPLNEYQTDCGHVHTEQIKRQLGTRLKEHRKGIFLCKEKLNFVGTCLPNQPCNSME